MDYKKSFRVIAKLAPNGEYYKEYHRSLQVIENFKERLASIDEKFPSFEGEQDHRLYYGEIAELEEKYDIAEKYVLEFKKWVQELFAFVKRENVKYRNDDIFFIKKKNLLTSCGRYLNTNTIDLNDFTFDTVK